MKKALAVLTIGAVATIVLLLFVFVVEPYVMNPDQTLYTDAINLQNQGNYAAALEKFQSLESNYPSSYYAVICFNNSLNCHYQYISSLITDGKYTEAQEQYAQLLDEYPVSVATTEKDSVLKDMPDEVLFEWATSSQNDTVSIRVFNVIITYQPNSQYATDAETALVNIQIDKIAVEGKTADLSSPYSKSSIQIDGKMQLTVVNDSPDKLEVFLRGTATRRIVIEGSPNSTTMLNPHNLLGQIRAREQANRATITLEPGTYEMALKTNVSRGMYGTVTFPSNTEYEYIFYEKFNSTQP